MVQLKKGGYALTRIGYDNETTCPIYALVKILSKPKTGEVDDEIFEITGKKYSSRFKNSVFVKYTDPAYADLENRKYNNQSCRRVLLENLVPVLKKSTSCQNR